MRLHNTFLLLFAWVSAASASAQIQVRTTLPASTFLLYEGIPLRVEIRNGGEDPLFIGGTNGTSELHLRVLDLQNRPIPASGIPAIDETWVIPPGRTDAREFDLVQLRNIRNALSFQAQAVLRAGEDSIAGTVHYFDVSNGTPHAKISRRAADRTFELIGLTRNSRDEMLLRVSTHDGKTSLNTYLLERHLRFYPPEMRVDDQGRAHTLHYKVPSLVVHCLFTPEGLPIDRRYYQVAPGLRVFLAPHPEDGYGVPGGTRIEAAAPGSQP